MAWPAPGNRHTGASGGGIHFRRAERGFGDENACSLTSAGVFISATRTTRRSISATAAATRSRSPAASSPAAAAAIRRHAGDVRRQPSGRRSICRTTGRSICRSSSDRGANAHGAKPLGRTYPETSIGWYRRTFDIPAVRSRPPHRDRVRRRLPRRDRHPERALHRPEPQRLRAVPLRRDRLLNYGTLTAPGANALVVRADATESEGWFYEGAGIYRHVWLEKTAPLHVAHWGTFVHVRTAVTPAGTRRSRSQTDVDQRRGRRRDVPRRVDDRRSATARPSRRPRRRRCSIAAWQTAHVHAAARRSRRPRSGRSKTRTSTSSRPTDRRPRRASSIATTRRSAFAPFGFDADTGFFLNGKPVKIKGMCNHQDHAGVGVGLPDRLQDFRIEKLKEMGVERVPHVAQPADAGAARRLRPARHAGARRDAHDVVERGGAEPARAPGPPRSQSSVGVLLVDRQRGTGAGAPSAARARPRR